MNTVLITGAAGSFGTALARVFSNNNWNVVATSRNIINKLNITTEYGSRIQWMKLDVTNPEDRVSVIDAASEEFGRIDVLVNNAGAFSSGSIEDITDEMIDHDFDSTFKGPILLTKEYIHQAKKQGIGKVFFISSTSSLPYEQGHKNFGLYSAYKAAVNRFSECLNESLKGTEISSTVIIPCNMRDYPYGDSRLEEESAVAMDTVASSILSVSNQCGRASTDKIIFRP